LLGGEKRRPLRFASFMRLSLLKAAHAAVTSAARQEIRVRSGRDDKGEVGFP